MDFFNIFKSCGKKDYVKPLEKSKSLEIEKKYGAFPPANFEEEIPNKLVEINLKKFYTYYPFTVAKKFKTHQRQSYLINQREVELANLIRGNTYKFYYDFDYNKMEKLAKFYQEPGSMNDKDVIIIFNSRDEFLFCEGKNSVKSYYRILTPE